LRVIIRKKRKKKKEKEKKEEEKDKGRPGRARRCWRGQTWSRTERREWRADLVAHFAAPVVHGLQHHCRHPPHLPGKTHINTFKEREREREREKAPVLLRKREEKERLIRIEINT